MHPERTSAGASNAAASDAPAPDAARHRLVRGIEFAALFGGFAVLAFLFRRHLAFFVIPTILVGGAVCLVALWRDPAFRRPTLWHTRGLGRQVGRALLRFVALAAPLTAGLLLWRPELLFNMLREEPGVWLGVMAVYPLLSVYPQEIIFRAFIFHRYRAVFRTRRARVAASATAFGAAHLFYANPVAAVLSGAGGWLFARGYARHRSVPAVSVEHALWGWYLFTIGLGYYFYGPAIG